MVTGFALRGSAGEVNYIAVIILIVFVLCGVWGLKLWLLYKKKHK